LDCKRSFCSPDFVAKSRHIAQYAYGFAPCRQTKILAFVFKAGFETPSSVFVAIFTCQAEIGAVVPISAWNGMVGNQQANYLVGHC
jgi:hypothetical protein